MVLVRLWELMLRYACKTPDEWNRICGQVLEGWHADVWVLADPAQGNGNCDSYISIGIACHGG